MLDEKVSLLGANVSSGTARPIILVRATILTFINQIGLEKCDIPQEHIFLL